MVGVDPCVDPLLEIRADTCLAGRQAEVRPYTRTFMSGQLRELKNRIKSVESTKKITYAMEMVSTAKRKRYQALMAEARPYMEALEGLMKRLAQNLSGGASHPFFEERPEGKTALVLITSDSGLCGSYNLDLVHQALGFLKEETHPTVLICLGRAGINALKREGYAIAKEWAEIKPAQFDGVITELQNYLSHLFLNGDVQAIHAVFSHFVTASQFKKITEKLLPLSKPETASVSVTTDYLYEPSAEFIFPKLIPAYFKAKVRQMFMESVVSEQIARMTAMHAATENATELIERLVLERNKARQASITKEILEIVSGSRALKFK